MLTYSAAFVFILFCVSKTHHDLPCCRHINLILDVGTGGGKTLCFFEVLDEKDINITVLLLMVDQVRVHIL